MLRIHEEALTFDDVLLIPAMSEVLPNDVCLKSKLTRDIDLNVPFLSASMDTVTEYRLAIAMAQEGGVGILHKNMPPEEQARQVRLVKKFESGVVKDPITIRPNQSIRDLLELTQMHKISGVPVVDGADLVGIVTSRDLRFETRLDAPVSKIMTVKDKLVTVKEGDDFSRIKHLLHKHRIEKILVVNDAFQLKGMITMKDIQKAEAYPFACKDELGRLRVGAAIGVGADSQVRLEALVEEGVDVVILDTAHGHSLGVLNRLRDIKKRFPKLQVIAGNVATAEGAKALADAGADGVKVGIGPGSICTTRIVAGIGVPQLTAVANAVAGLKGTGIPVIADGGIRFSGDCAKAIAAGASAIMVGSLFAGTEESPGEVELYQGRYYKAYRGMGSIGAMSQSHGSSDRYFQDGTAGAGKLVPEGIEGRVPYKGPISAIVYQLVGGIRAGMGYTGSADIEQMQTKTQFVRISNAGIRESHVHDVSITKEAPNYRS